MKKGITCSGTGKSFRFVEQSEPLIKPKGSAQRKMILAAHQKQENARAHAFSSNHHSSTNNLDLQTTYELIDCDDNEADQIFSDAELDFALSPTITEVNEDDRASVRGCEMALVKASALETLTPGLRMLFDHCTKYRSM